MPGNWHAGFGEGPTEKDPLAGTSPAAHSTPLRPCQHTARPRRPARGRLGNLPFRYGFRASAILAITGCRLRPQRADYVRSGPSRYPSISARRSAMYSSRSGPPTSSHARIASCVTAVTSRAAQ